MDIKPKFRCSISMRQHSLNIFSDYLNIYSILKKGDFVPYIPGYKCSKQKAKSDYSIIFIQTKTFSAQLSPDFKTLTISGSIEDITKGRTIPYMTHYLLERPRQYTAQLTTQGAAVSYNNNAIVLLGKRGSGKSSITLELCRKHGYALIGNDILLMGLANNQGIVYDGTKIFVLRLSSIKHYNTDLIKYFTQVNLKDAWTAKTSISPEKLNVKIQSKPAKIKKCFYVHLENNLDAPLLIKKIDHRNSLYMGRLYLYETFSRYIRGVCIPILKGEKPELSSYLPSLDDQICHDKRLNLISWLMDDLGFYYISGSMDAICRYINSKIK